MGLETSCFLWQSNQTLDAFPQSAPKIQVLLCCIRSLLWEFECPAFANGQFLMLQIKINAQTPHRGIPKSDGVSSSRVYITAELSGDVFSLHYQITKDTSTQSGKQRPKTALKSRLTYHTYYLYVSTCSGMDLRLSSLQRESLAVVVTQHRPKIFFLVFGKVLHRSKTPSACCCSTLNLRGDDMESQKMKAQIKETKTTPLLFISAFRPLELGIKSSGVNKLETLKLFMQSASSKTGGICSKAS